MSYQVVIGLEVHAQLATATKMFCSCQVEFGAPPNTHVCPVCLGMPGSLPVPNEKAVSYAVLMGLATGCRIDREAMWTRKNYFYPDSPKNYQITQQGGMELYDRPICTHGQVAVVMDDGSEKQIRLKRIHMEEDAGKLIHDLTPEDSLFDANRCGTPLLEIVTEPDLRSSREAFLYLEKLKQMLEYLEICDANMEKGNLRCDANISLRKDEISPLGTRVELKNMNSFHNLEKAVEVEIALQSKTLDEGGVVVQETKRWDPVNNVTISMRSKEEAEDYRYFPEPDMIRLTTVDDAFIEEVRATLPELPDARRARYVTEFGIPEYDARVLTLEKELAEYFEKACRIGRDKKLVSNWVMGEVLRRQNEDEGGFPGFAVNPEDVGTLVNLIEDGVISGKIAKTVFDEMCKTGRQPGTIIEEKNLRVISDSGAIESLVEKVIGSHPAQVEEYKAGKSKVIGFLVGQVMKLSQGKADPPTVNALFQRKLLG